MMEYLVTRVRRGAEDHQDWTVATGPEGNLETPAMGLEYQDSLDLMGPSGRRVRKENLSSSQMMVSRVCQEHQERPVNLESEVLMVRLVWSVQEAQKDTLAHLVLLVPRG